MNDATQENQMPATGEAKPVAYCQHCGRPLNKETVRVVGPAVYCEPCLAARLTGAPSGVPPGPAYGPVNPGTPSSPSAWATISPARPNPGLAFLLGMIPGVGAMYNEQYAKGIAHLFIFALLVSLSHLTEIFGLFTFGWVCYMAIEAHHTAKARRDGTALPNPFGLNDIGERLGFDPSLRGSAHGTRPAGQPADAYAAGSAGGAAPPYSPPVSAEGASAYRAPEQSAATWRAPVDPPAYGRASDPASAHLPPASAHSPFEQPYAYAPPAPFGYPPPVPPYGAVNAPPDPAPDPTSSDSRFPAGAIGLMALGTIFLLGTTGIFHNVSGPVLVGFGMIGLGAWVFTRRFTSPAAGRNADAFDYRRRILSALMPAFWLILIGTLVLLDALGLIHWAYSWPWIIIFAGLLQLVKRSIYRSAGEATAHDSFSASTATHPLATDLSQEPGATSFRDGR